MPTPPPDDQQHEHQHVPRAIRTSLFEFLLVVIVAVAVIIARPDLVLTQVDGGHYPYATHIEETP